MSYPLWVNLYLDEIIIIFFQISPIKSDDGSASGQNIYESTPCKTGSELREQVLDQLRNPEQLNLEEESRIRRSSSENSVFQQVSLDVHGMDSRYLIFKLNKIFFRENILKKEFFF